MTRKKTWPPSYTDDDDYTHVTLIDGRPLRRYGNQWCAQTRAGTWRSASWLGAVNIGRLLDLNARPRPEQIDGQQTLPDTNKETP